VIDLKRLLGFAAGMGLLAACGLVAALTVVPAVLEPWMNRLIEVNRTGPLASYEIIGGRIAALSDQGWDKPRKPGDIRLGVTLGASGCGCAVDTIKLSAGSGSIPTRWAPLSGLAVTPADVEIVTNQLIQASIRPDCALIGIDTGELAKARIDKVWFYEKGAPTVHEILKHLKTHPTRLARDLVDEVRYFKEHLLPFRQAMQRHFPVQLFDVRLRLFSAIGIKPPLLYKPESSLWALPERDVAFDEPVNLQLIENQRAMGKFDAKNYSIDGPNVRALIETIRVLNKAGTEVIILLVPEESRIRKYRPLEAMAVLRTSLASAFGAGAPAVLDFRDAVADDKFTDVQHVNTEGREIVTERLIRSLAPPRVH
jgi:hypothetical protein